MYTLSKFISTFLGLTLFLVATPLLGQEALTKCGTSDFLNETYLKKITSKKDLTTVRIGSNEKLEYRVALDINYNTFLLYGGDKEKIKQVAYDYINSASEVFESEINIKLAVSYIHIWDVPEPYSPQSDDDYYGMVENYWNNNRYEPRDAVIAFSVRNGWFYGGFRMCTANFPPPDYPLLRPDLLCHELGHTLGSPHTHSCFWPNGPIDYCENIELTTSECNSNYKDYPRGSLMSYCRGTMSFHPLCRNLMRYYSEGDVNSEFSLKPIVNVNDPISFSINVSESNFISNTPSFQLYPLTTANKYRIQIAADISFIEIFEDTIINQPYYKSLGLDGGSYYARVRVENTDKSNSVWSTIDQFIISQQFELLIPPKPYNLKVFNDRSISGQFNNYDTAEEYEIRITDQSGGFKNYQLPANISRTSFFKLSFEFPLNSYMKFQVKLRLKSNGLWSKWSEQTEFENPVNSEIWRMASSNQISSAPIIASYIFTNNQTKPGIGNYVEIAADSSFSNVLFSDIKKFNQINDRYPNLHITNPHLVENKRLYFRSRPSFPNSDDSRWKDTEIVTGWNDKRFEFKSVVDTSDISANNYNYPVNKFYKSDSGIYVYSRYNGYSYSEDLVNWRQFNVPKTKGKSPGPIIKFAALDSGFVQILDDQGVLITKKNSVYHYLPIPRLLWTYSYEHLAHVPVEGVFFITNQGNVSRIKNGDIETYGTSIFPNRVVKLASSKTEIWAITERGRVLSFKNEKWQSQPTVNGWEYIVGISFNENDIPYVYGDWGVVFLDAQNGTWKVVNSLINKPVKKVVFDGNGTLWAATYQYDNDSYINRSLIKVLSDETTNIYDDGLNFPNEAFDIEYFNDKLAILTNSGIVLTFEENQIQRFEPKQVYCTGDSISVTLATNSTFQKSNQTSLIFYNVNNQDSLIFNNINVDSNRFGISINEQIPGGNYFIKTVTTSPRILSNESTSFRVSHGSIVHIQEKKNMPYLTDLSVETEVPLELQWFRNGELLSGEKDNIIHTSQSGEFHVEATNGYGCKSKSNSLFLVQDEPNSDMLLQNYPNPYNNATNISYYLKKDQNVKLELYNTSGKLLKTLVDSFQINGWHNYELHSSEIATGTYLYRIITEGFESTLKLLKI